MRIPPGPSDSPTAERIRERRGGELRPLDQALLHNAALADGWNGFLGALRSTESIDAALRELIVLRVAVLNDATYEWAAHEPVARAAGVPTEQLDALKNADLDDVLSGPFNDTERAVLRMTDASTRKVSVDPAEFDAVRTRLGDSGVVEVALLVAAYNMVSRFLVAVDLTAADFPAVTA